MLVVVAGGLGVVVGTVALSLLSVYFPVPAFSVLSLSHTTVIASVDPSEDLSCRPEGPLFGTYLLFRSRRFSGVLPATYYYDILCDSVISTGCSVPADMPLHGSCFQIATAEMNRILQGCR